jgi:hypothetical protein
VIALAGCRFHFDERSDGGPADVPLGPFSAPQPLTELNSTSDDYEPWLSEDRLEILFTSTRNGPLRIFRAQRATPTGAFDPPAELPISGIGGSDAIGDPFVTDDGLTLWFSRIESAGGFAVRTATRASTADEFANPLIVNGLDTMSDDKGPTISSDELTLVFHSKRLGSEDLFIATRTSKAASWDPPVLLDTLSTPTSQDCCSSLAGDASSLAFASDSVKGRLQLYVSRRGPSGFAAPEVLDPNLASDHDDTDVFLTRDQRTVVFASKRATDPYYDLYIADR